MHPPQPSPPLFLKQPFHFPPSPPQSSSFFRKLPLSPFSPSSSSSSNLLLSAPSQLHDRWRHLKKHDGECFVYLGGLVICTLLLLLYIICQLMAAKLENSFSMNLKAMFKVLIVHWYGVCPCFGFFSSKYHHHSHSFLVG